MSAGVLCTWCSSAWGGGTRSHQPPPRGPLWSPMTPPYPPLLRMRSQGAGFGVLGEVRTPGCPPPPHPMSPRDGGCPPRRLLRLGGVGGPRLDGSKDRAGEGRAVRAPMGVPCPLCPRLGLSSGPCCLQRGSHGKGGALKWGSHGTEGGPRHRVRVWGTLCWSHSSL